MALGRTFMLRGLSCTLRARIGPPISTACFSRRRFGTDACEAVSAIPPSREPIAKRIAFIGAGKMGEAMIGGLKLQRPSQNVPA